MARKLLTEVTCSRCKRTWYAPVPDATNPDKVDCTSIKISVKGPGAFVKEVDFDTLCEACASLAMSRIEEIDRDMTKSSPHRKSKASEKGAEAPIPAKPVAPQAATAPVGGPLPPNAAPIRSTTGSLPAKVHQP